MLFSSSLDLELITRDAPISRIESFLSGKRPEENFDDGLDVTYLLMAAYMSAEQGKTIKLPNKEI